MPKENVPLVAFNRGIVSRLGLARVDLKRTAMSAEIQTNWMPRTLGSMMLRPGLQYIDSTRNDAKAVHIPFIFSLEDTAIIELTDSAMRVRVDEEIITREAVSTAITNGRFDTDVSGWTDADETGATSQWASGGYLSLAGTDFNSAIRTQQVTVSVADRNVEHALDVVVTRGPVTVKVGSTSMGQEYLAETELGAGSYSLAFTPSGNFFITLSNRRQTAALLSSITVAAAGDMVVGTPWAEGDLSAVRWDESADVVYTASAVQQRKILRYATRSWGIALYQPEDGPFRNANVGTVTISANQRAGDVTLTASKDLFKSSHVGALFKINSTGQAVSDTLAGADQFTDSIRVSGVGATQRTFTIVSSGTWSGKINLQRSIDDVSWTDVDTGSTVNVSATYNDGLDNQVIHYRIGFATGNYASGSAVCTLTYGTGSNTGIARITGFTSPTSVTAAVLKDLGNTSGTADWSEGAWSDYRGYPSALALHEGRLWHAGKDKIDGSVSDAFESFDGDTEGDSGPISRSIGSGPVDSINWLLALQRLVVGGQMAERSARASSLDEPLTPTSFVLKDASTRGSTAVPPAKIDKAGIFVRGTRLFLLSNESDPYADYGSADLTQLCPEVGAGGFARIAVQRYPDTRVHCVRQDGGVAVLILDQVEEVRCWVKVETDGLVEDVFVLPGATTSDEDKVYYVVNRTINGTTKRYLERWALESECVGGTLNKQADSFVLYSGVATTTLTGLSHLEGEEVVVWADGRDLSPLDDAGQPTTYTVTGGSITLAEPVSEAVVGLYYEALFKGAKLAYAAAMGTALTQRKRVNYLGLILADTHARGLLHGTDFDYLEPLPMEKDGAPVDEDEVHAAYDMDAVEVNDVWNTDSRLCLKACSPRPCTVLAGVVSVSTHDKG